MIKNALPILLAPIFSLQACASETISNLKTEAAATSQGQKLSLKQQIQKCEKDLANTLGVASDQIKTVSSEHVTWRSGALGCPSPGAQYTQGLVPGVRIVLEANGNRYSYHAHANGVPFYCPRPKNKKPTPLYQER